jgi:hypothetical protein
MATQLSLKNRPPFLSFLVIPYSPEPVVYFLAPHTEFLVAGLAEKDKFSLSILTTVMVKTKKIKGVRPAILLACPFLFKSTKTDYAGLL